jgi:hypothetical protein
MKTKEKLVWILIGLFMLSICGLVITGGIYYKAALICACIMCVSFVILLIVSWIIPDLDAWILKRKA